MIMNGVYVLSNHIILNISKKCVRNLVSTRPIYGIVD